MITILTVALISLAVGLFCGWLAGRTHSSGLTKKLTASEAELTIRVQELTTLRTEREALSAQKAASDAENARLQERVTQERKSSDEKLALLASASEDLKNAFQKLASDALSGNNQSFLDLAKTRLGTYQELAEKELQARQQAIANLVKPIEESLKAVDDQVKIIEKERVGAYTALHEQLKSVVGTQEQLKSETGKLVQALRAPHVRGRWGEFQLRRVVEMAGMVNYCDFQEQASVTTSEGRLRPDLIVRLPGGKTIIVDAKAPLSAYLDAIEAPDENTRRARMAAHASQIRDHINKLSAKGYWDQFAATPEFVVMFLPGEVFFSAALEQDPSLIEQGVQQKVIVASPTTLIALLRAAFYGWQQTQLAENAQRISDLGKRIYEAIRVMSSHFEDVGDHLEKALKSYNKTVGSLERSVLPAARRMPSLGVSASEPIDELEQRNETARILQAPDWPGGDGADSDNSDKA